MIERRGGKRWIPLNSNTPHYKGQLVQNSLLLNKSRKVGKLNIQRPPVSSFHSNKCHLDRGTDWDIEYHLDRNTQLDKDIECSPMCLLDNSRRMDRLDK